MIKKKRGFRKESRRSFRRKFNTSFFLLFLLVGIFILLLNFFIQEFYVEEVRLSESVWRSSMFPENWEPIDKIGVVEGVNVFSDVEGTKDENGNSVSEAHPAYHPKRFLHDFSYAGYHSGEKPIPPEDPNAWTKRASVFDVTKSPYNCVADGEMDCRDAIQRAIDDAENAGRGIVYLPVGEYRISAANSYYFLHLSKSNIVIRGDGSDKTKIKVDPYYKGVFDVRDKSVFLAEPKGEGDYGWSVVGNSVSITKDLPFPTKVIPVSDVSGFKIGDPIIIEGYWTDEYIAEHDMQGVWQPGNKIAYTWRRTIRGLDPARKEISIDVPTRYRVKKTDNPVVAKTKQGISEIGLEHFSIGEIRHPLEWPDSADSDSADAIVKSMKGHYVIAFRNVWNGWMYDLKSYRPQENANRQTDNTLYGKYDVEILNMVVYMKHAQFVTLKNFYFKNMQVDDNPGGGHGYAITLFATNDVLVESGTLQKVKKGFAFNRGGASGNVIKDVTVKEVFTTQNDFHSYLGSANLIDNNNLEGTYWEAAVRPLDPPPGTDHGHGTSESVFWNTKGARLTLPVLTWWDRDNDNDNKRDDDEPHGAFADEGIIVSNQFGWGYIIGTHGLFSDVITARMPDRRIGNNFWKPTILPRDYREGIGYDKDPKYVGRSLEPRSLYEGQLALRLGKKPPVRPVKVEGIIIDNNDEGFSKEGGAWQVSKAVGYYGVDSVFSRGPGNAAFWTAQLSPGLYRVYAWWTYLDSRSENVPYSIYNGDSLLGTVRVNQRNSNLAGNWNLLGEYSFDKTAKVVLKVENNDASYNADAVRFFKVKDIDPVKCVPEKEICDGEDNDCDNEVDEGVKKNFYADKDRDKYGAGESVQACVAPVGYVENSRDCSDDNHPELNVMRDCSYNGNGCGKFSLCINECPLPPAEQCNNVDDDCDNEVDEVCPPTRPKLSLTSPIEGLVYQQRSVPIIFDSENAASCQYELNGIKKNIVCAKKGLPFSWLSDLLHGEYSFKLVADNNGQQTSVERKFKIEIKEGKKFVVKYVRFKGKGKTTDLDKKSDDELKRVSIVLDDDHGAIEFSENIDLTADADISNTIDIDSNVNISKGKVEVKSDVLKSLNKKAKVSLRALNLVNPRILKNGNVCYEPDCVKESYVNGTFIFNVVGFSIYGVEETSVAPPQNQDEEPPRPPIDDGPGRYPVKKPNVTDEKNDSKGNVIDFAKLQRIIIKDDMSLFLVKDGEDVILEIDGNEERVGFGILEDSVIMKTFSESYEIKNRKIGEIFLNGKEVYVAVNELREGNAVIVIGFDREEVSRNVEIDKSRERVKVTYILAIIFVFMLIIVVSLYLYYLLKSNYYNVYREDY